MGWSAGSFMQTWLNGQWEVLGDFVHFEKMRNQSSVGCSIAPHSLHSPPTTNTCISSYTYPKLTFHIFLSLILLLWKSSPIVSALTQKCWKPLNMQYSYASSGQFEIMLNKCKWKLCLLRNPFCSSTPFNVCMFILAKNKQALCT